MSRPFQGPSALVALLAFAWAETSLCASPVDVILPAATVVTEQQPDRRFDSSTILGTLQTGLTAAPEFRLLRLGADRLLGEDDRAVMIVPVVTSARSSREVKAAAVAEITAHIGGGLWVLDPWTNTALYTATRLVSAPVQVSVEAVAREDELTRAAFREASGRWVEACLDQLRREASPFIVEGATAAVPAGALQTRGIWLRGSSHGVRPGMVIRSTSGSLARVETVNERFSTIRDVAEAGARVPRGVSYRGVSVSRPTERPEPVVVVRWLGKEPRSPDEATGLSVISAAAVTDIVQSYAAKGGGLRFVPASAGGLAASDAFRDLTEYVSRHTKLATTSMGMTLHRETKVRMAEEEPSVVAEVGVLGAHHGVRARADGAREHLFRVSLLAAVGTPSARGGLALAKTVDAASELAVVEMSEVREVDQADAWFTVWRNACILLGEQVRATALETLARAGTGTVEARVEADGAVTWPAASAGPYTPLSWLRPIGEVIGPDVLERFGILLERIEPSQGFLNPGNLGAEKIRPGDVLAYRARAVANPPVVMVLGGDGAAEDVILDAPVLSRIGAGVLASTGGVTPHLDPSPSSWGSAPLVQILVEQPSIEETPLATGIAGNWRFRLWINGVPDAGEPALKAGIAYREERRYEAGHPPLLPRDRNAELIVWAKNALHQVVSKAVERGLGKMVGAGAPAATIRKE